MARQSAKKKPINPKNSTRTESKVIKALIFIPIAALIFKLSVISKLQQLGYVGSDFENYFDAANGLLRDGFFSKEPLLSYFPAGYPLLIWPIASISIDGTQTILSVIQSIFFAYATYFFTKKLRKTELSHLAVLSSVLITFNPTLSLATLTVGYESSVAACLLMAGGILLQQRNWINSNRYYLYTFFFTAWLGLATFLQPRYLFAALILISLTLYIASSKTLRIKVAAIALITLSIFPGALVLRNAIAIDKPTISTNLGITMRIGAGEETDGSYLRQGPVLPCEPDKGQTAVSDNDLVKCVLVWYAKNPVQAVELALNKARFFWTPWSGPLVNGTIGRNPSLEYSPVMTLNRSSESWHNFIYGVYGKVISYLWLLGQLALLFIGFKHLWGQNKLSALVISSPVLAGWLITMATIGDSRFRIPTMSLSLVIQGAGIIAIKRKFIKAV
jgi:hypothetical protein